MVSVALQAVDPGPASTALTTALVAGGFTVLGVVLTLAGTMLSNWQKSRHDAEAALQAEVRDADRTRDREIRERAAMFSGALQHLVDLAVASDLIAAAAQAKQIELRLNAQGAFDAFMFVAPADLTLAADKTWQAYEEFQRDGASATSDKLQQYYRARYAFTNAIRAEFGLETLPA